MATITKRLCLQVGEYTDSNGTKKREYRDIGVMLEFRDDQGNAWNEIKLNLDILNPQLFALSKRYVTQGQSGARVKLFDVARRQRENTPPDTVPDTEDPLTDEDIPY